MTARQLRIQQQKIAMATNGGAVPSRLYTNQSVHPHPFAGLRWQHLHAASWHVPRLPARSTAAGLGRPSHASHPLQPVLLG